MAPKLGYRKPFPREWHNVALEAIQAGATYREASACAGVSEVTLQRFLSKREHHGAKPVRSTKRRGRKNPEWLDVVLRALGEGCSIKGAARLVDVPIRSVRYYVRRDRKRLKTDNPVSVP